MSDRRWKRKQQVWIWYVARRPPLWTMWRLKPPRFVPDSASSKRIKTPWFLVHQLIQLTDWRIWKWQRKDVNSESLVKIVAARPDCVEAAKMVCFRDESDMHRWDWDLIDATISTRGCFPSVQNSTLCRAPLTPCFFSALLASIKTLICWAWAWEFSLKSVVAWAQKVLLVEGGILL